MNRIKELRMEKGLTQSQLGAYLRLNQTAIGKYERGELEPNLQNLIALADFFECSVDYLISRTDDFGNVNVSPPIGEQLTQEEKEIIQMYRGLDGELQRRTLAYIRRLNDTVGDESDVTSFAKHSIQKDKRRP